MSKRPDNIERNKSEYMRKAVSLSHKGMKHTEESKKKMSDSLKGKPSPMKGKKHTKESIEKMRESSLGQVAWNKGLTKDDPRVLAYTSKSGSTRKEKGSQRGKNHWAFGKKRPESADIIRKTMASGKMEKTRNTKPELKMKQLLDDAGINYIFQAHIATYIVDFYIPSQNLVIEVDGEYWHNFPHGRAKDRLRDSILRSRHYNVIRYWAKDVLSMAVVALP